MSEAYRTSVVIILVLYAFSGAAGWAHSAAVVQLADEALSSEDAAKLIEGDEEERDGNWTKAAEAYKDALGSKDPRVRVIAKQGYERARAHMRHWYWPLLEYVTPLRWVLRHLGLTAILLLLAVFYISRKYYGRRLIIEVPIRVSQGAPVEIFAAAMAAAAEKIRQVYKYEDERWSAGHYARSIAGPKAVSLAPIQDIAASLPDISGISVSKVFKSVRALVHFFRWRVESGLEVASNGDTTAYALVRWAWATRGPWIESVAAPNPTQTQGASPAQTALADPSSPAPESEATLRLKAVARRLACDIVGRDLIT